MKLTLRTLIGIILTIAVLFFSFQILKESKERQILVIENAEINNVKYGLLSVFSWKRQVSEILTKKIREFELTTENRRVLRMHIQDGMYKMLDELEEILEDKRNEGDWWDRLITSSVQSFIQTFTFSINDLRYKVPEFTEIILDELDNYESRENLRVFIQNKIDELLYKTIGEEDLSKLEYIVDQNNCDDIDDCKSIISYNLREADQNLITKSLIIVGLSFLIFLIILFKNMVMRKSEHIVLIVLCGILLYVGLNTPMIDIDARITDFSFLLMGEPLQFKDQILFFQSKSIFEVVKILINTGEFQSIIVGVLIFLFSIVFPISKLLSSFVIVHRPALQTNKIINFLAFKSGKWSMADVLVVAIFMAYIGFRGVIENQLKQLENISSKIQILTTDNSNFGVGFILFLAFCIGGLIIATIIEKNISHEN